MPWFSRHRRKDPPPPVSPASPATESLDILLSGRLYRKDVPYMLPVDVQEINRLDFQHYVLHEAINANLIAPVELPDQILDVGCGTGRWLLEVAQQFPQAQLTGIDLQLPPLPASSWPTNCRFVQGNLLKGLPFGDAAFSYVHQRFLVTALPEKDWPQVIAELARVTASGGWLEFGEVLHYMAPTGPAGQQMRSWVEKFCATRGINPAIGESLPALLRASPALTDVQAYHLDIPVGSWKQTRLGKYIAQSHLATYRSVKPLYVEQMQVDAQLFDHVITSMEKEWDTYQAHSRFYFAYARRV